MKPRWWKRLWLRYLYYCRQHWIIAGVITGWALWGVLQVAIQLLPVLLQFVFEFGISLIAAI
jgi:phage shock protein PspC (stress-responsive transcriptional regulator)